MDEPREPRISEPPPPPLDRYLRLAQERLSAAQGSRGGAGSPEALNAAQEAIGYLGMALANHIGPMAAADAKADSRDDWLAVLRFLSGTLMFKPQLSSLVIALTELDRGMVDPRLEPSNKAQGGRTPTDQLYWQAVAVEAFDELVEHLGAIGKAEDEIEDVLSVSRSTVRDWRARVRKEAPAEWKNRPANIRWRFDKDGHRVDPLHAFHFAYTQATA